MTRMLGAVVAVLLITAHEVSDYDGWLVVATVAWTTISLTAYASARLQDAPGMWLLDCAVVLGLIYLSTDWRSPFYIYAVTALIMPATGLRFRAAVAWGIGFVLAYLGVAIATQRFGNPFDRATRLEVATAHLLIPIVVTMALAYASELLRQLREERRRAEQMAIQAERQRIAWELHDSAKQRVHAAHLVLSALDGRGGEIVEHALSELRAATADMDTSVAELRAPLDGRPVDVLLRERARELNVASPADIVVRGGLPEMPPLVANHTYRIAAEALTNAVRHASASRIAVELSGDDDVASIVIRDDGAGLPEVQRPGSHGLHSMRNRASTIGASLDLQAGPDGGTVVTLDVPLTTPTSEAVT